MMTLIVCQNNVRIYKDPRLIQFMQVWHDIFEGDEEIIDFNAIPHLIDQIDTFYSMHSYDKNTIQYATTIESGDIEQCIDSISLQFLKQECNYGVPCDELTNWVQSIDPLLSECYRLNCVELIEVLNISIAVYFYIEGVSEKDFQQFTQRWGMQYPLTPLQQRQILENNKYIFDRKR